MDAPLSVKRLLEQIKSRVEPAFAAVCVVGEVSNARTSGKHWYFTLKDEGAVLQCAVWASQQRFLTHAPQEGQRVIVKGSLNVYLAGGSLTLAVTHCELAGVGDLRERLRQLEMELRSEGLFDRPKRPIPAMPKRIGIVAALGGAALRDVLEVTRRRAPGIDLLVYPAAAQGGACVTENILALQEIQDSFWQCDLVLLVRGGGSLEDLWGYNDPELVRAVANCRIPTITGVGHEIDTTLVDLAADRRAATPSQAAEIATPDRQQLSSELSRLTAGLMAKMRWRMMGFETELNLRADRGLLKLNPLGTGQCRLEALQRRLHLAHPQRRLDQTWMRHSLLRQRLVHAASAASGELDLTRLHDAKRRLGPAIQSRIALAQNRWQIRYTQLQGLDPQAPLQRGFVLVKDEAGKPVLSSQALPQESEARLQWLDGERKARVH